ncbi:MAG: hypothetical protein ACM3N4_02155 [Nitrososphaerota archaeon]
MKAVIFAEMLVWSDARIRGQTPEGSETLFRPRELQQMGGRRWQSVRDALWMLCPPALHLFNRAWHFSVLADCPDLSEWALALLGIVV